MPRWLIFPAILLALLSLVPFVLLAKSRGQTSTTTRLSIIQDMGHQPRFGPQAGTPLFADGRAARLPVDGTVARGELRDDARYNRGLEEDGKFVKRTPASLPVTKERLLRGQERMNARLRESYQMIQKHFKGGLPKEAQPPEYQ